ncbi:hypothetical protein ACPPVT_14375 [Angustibacter sp. McL0619]|uniref:hypothetical protein n=1 Tax=Angustibacter sp. McL0619 TaxID=3415676 RepID=UPI003CEC4E06
MISAALRWIVTTPRRALTVAVLAAVLLICLPGLQLVRAAGHANLVAGQLIAQSRAARTTDPATAGATDVGPTDNPSSTDAATADLHAGASPAGERPAPEPPQGAVSAARSFATLWLAGRTATSTSAWLASLRPVVAPGLVPFLSTTNRQEIPLGQAGAPVPDLQGTATTQRFTVATTPTTKLEVDVDFDGTRWMVTTFGPVA